MKDFFYKIFIPIRTLVLKKYNYKISNILDLSHDVLLRIVNIWHENKLRIFIGFVKKFREDLFKKIMFNYIYDLFKNKYVLNFFVFFIIFSLFIIFFKITNDFFHLFMCFLILLLSGFVLKILIIKFQDTEQIQFLNLIFLYLNLVMFILFFFSWFDVFFSQNDVFTSSNLYIFFSKNVKLIITMFFLIFFAFSSLKKEKTQKILRENIYIARCSRVFEKRIQPTSKLGFELCLIIFVLSLLLAIPQYLQQWSFLFPLYICKFIYILIIFFIFLLFLLSIWFFVVLFFYSKKMNTQLKKKYKKEKYYRILNKN